MKLTDQQRMELGRWHTDVDAEYARQFDTNTAVGLSEAQRDLAATRQLLEQYKRALQDISAIDNRIDCGDWDEIEEARAIANAALSAKEKKA